MLARTLASPLLVAVALTLGFGCEKKPKMTEVEVPDAGVTLRYDLTPGQEYDGHVKMRTNIQTPMGDISMTVSFDAKIEVSNKAEAGTQLVRATVTNLEATTRLPEGIPAGAAGGGMSTESLAPLNGMELRFNLDPRGDVSNEPEPPEGAPDEIKQAIGMITAGLTAGFSVRLPEEPLKAGATWDAKPAELDEGVKSLTSTGSLDGLARNDAGEDVAMVALQSKSESERSQGEMTVQIKQDVETKAAFSASGGYPVSVDRKINNDIGGQATILTEIEAKWTKGAKQDVGPVQETAPSDDVQTQVIDDPCDPDYVGAEECADDAAPADDAAAEGEGGEAAEGDAK